MTRTATAFTERKYGHGLRIRMNGNVRLETTHNERVVGAVEMIVDDDDDDDDDDIWFQFRR